MVPAEPSPAALFKKLFLQGTPEEVEREAQSLNDGGSILDHLKSQTDALRGRVSAADKQKLDQYFNAAEKLGRSCYAMEIDPTHVQATVTRWEAFTGQHVVRQRSACASRRRTP